MAGARPSLAFLQGTHARVLTVALLLQIAGLYAISRQELVPLRTPLEQFPAVAGPWTLTSDNPVEEAVADVLKADDIMSRVYANPGRNRAASLFIAYFQSQRAGQAPHSPKNCLPGSGWVPSEAGTVAIRVPGRPEPIEVNKYVVSKGESRSVVLYWYQSHQRIIASEYTAKIYQVLDAIRFNRTDTALVRVVVPSGEDTAEALGTATGFVQSVFPLLAAHLPS